MRLQALHLTRHLAFRCQLFPDVLAHTHKSNFVAFCQEYQGHKGKLSIKMDLGEGVDGIYQAHETDQW
jgi:hypothetical protein